MINKDIFVGVIREVVSYNENGLKIKVETVTRSDTDEETVTVAIPKDKVKVDYFITGNTVVVKPTVTSSTNRSRYFTAERISVVSGPNNV